MGAAANRQIIERFWQDLYRRDFDKVGAYFAPDGHYRDVPAPDEGAFGPAAVAARLRLGLGPIREYHHRLRHIVAQGDLVVTEHAEEWRWHTGESGPRVRRSFSLRIAGRMIFENQIARPDGSVTSVVPENGVSALWARSRSSASQLRRI